MKQCELDGCSNTFDETKLQNKNPQRFCSRECANKHIAANKSFNKECIICYKEYKAKAPNQKTCSKECFVEHRKAKRDSRREKNKKEWICRYCNKSFFRERKRNGFCSRSCASKHYIENGTYDVWRNTCMDLSGVYKKCIICNEEFYAEPREVDTKKICGKKSCRKKYMSELFSGESNPSYGSKEKKSSKTKRIKTLNEKYGVDNAFELAKHTMTSKSQKEIYEILLNKFENKDVFINKKIYINNSKQFYICDIFIKSINVCIEYNGDYWHCNPIKYEKDYFNRKKQKHAYEIWERDNQKINDYKKMGYNVLVIWENDYKNNHEYVIKTLDDLSQKGVSLLNEEKENTNDQ